MTRNGLPQVVSYGGGLDSWAMLLDAERRGERPDCVAFVDVADGDEHADGEDPGEWPSTYRHIREVVIPWCRARGIYFAWIASRDYPVRDARSLFSWMFARRQIPVAGPRRICTTVAKVERFEAWLDRTLPGRTVEVWIGFEAGEEDRAAKDLNAGTQRAPKSGQAVRKNRFPLMESGLCRCRCEELARASGLPVPRKSACVFCPYASKGDWQTFARELPEHFARVAELEAQKPPTSRGRKLSIMAFRSFERRPAPVRTKLRILRDNDGHAYSAPTVSEFIQGGFKPVRRPCLVCGARDRATKATGCTYLADVA